MKMRRYRDLEVWQYSMALVLETYKCTAAYPAAERYGLVSQTRRAAVSIPSNVAEGQGRSQPGEFLNQLSVARGSLQELETLLILAQRLGYLDSSRLGELLARSDRISRMLTGLRKTVERSRLGTTREPQHAPDQ